MTETIADIALPVDERHRIMRNRIKGGSSTRRISIVTGVHGDELEGQYVCYALQQRLKENPGMLDGIVDIYPGMNPLGIDSVMRGIPAFDLDMNRIFPGSSDGDMNEHIASLIVDALSGSEVVLDIHASNIFLTEVPQIRINEKHRENLLPLALRTNIDFIWIHGSATVLEATLAYSLNSIGTKTLVVEMGVGMRITKSYGEQLTDGILALMKEIGMWKGEATTPRTPIVCDDPDAVCYLNSPSAGIFIRRAEHGQMVRKGQSLGIIASPLTGEELADVTAPADGWLFTLRDYPVTDSGSLLARILKKEAL